MTLRPTISMKRDSGDLNRSFKLGFNCFNSINLFYLKTNFIKLGKRGHKIN